MKKAVRPISLLAIGLFLVLGSAAARITAKPLPGREKQKSRRKAWISLFDGRSLQGWHGYNKTGQVNNWVVEDGALVCLGSAKGRSRQRAGKKYRPVFNQNNIQQP